MGRPRGDTSAPASEAAERAVLGAVLLDPSTLAAVAARLVAEDFYLERHGLLFAAMVELRTEGVEADLRTLQAKLEQWGKFEQVGGIAYLAQLDLDLPDLSRLDAYVEIVKERALRRRLIRVCGGIIREARDGGLAAPEAIARAEREIGALTRESFRPRFASLTEVLTSTLEQLEERPGAVLSGLPSGFAELDRMTFGLGAGNLILIAGRPGMGKTALALNIAQHVGLRRQEGVALFSLEMSRRELALRILCSESEIPFGRLRSGYLSQRQWARIIATVRRCSGAPIWIDDDAGQTLAAVVAKASRIKAERGLALVIVDYLQLLETGGRYGNRNLEMEAISRGLKRLAKDLEVPVIALSQLSRQPERRGNDHRPQLADLRESGALEQDADLVAFVYRDEVYNPGEEANRGLAELIIAKHRHGETGTVELTFLGEITTFRDLGHAAGEAPLGGPA